VDVSGFRACSAEAQADRGHSQERLNSAHTVRRYKMVSIGEVMHSLAVSNAFMAASFEVPQK
jgi:hypothetical protein